MFKDVLLKKISERTACICVIGLGYVGLPLSLLFSKKGFPVIGIDIDSKKVEQINKGQSYISTISSADIKAGLEKGFCATVSFDVIKDADAIILCLPTPLNKNKEPDLSYITETVKAIQPFLRNGQVISLESTTYPGTTEEEVLPYLEKRKFIVGENIFLVYSPEREDPGNSHYNTASIPKVCSGHTKYCLEICVALYKAIIQDIVPVSSTKAAEMVKLLENIHRAVNIGLVNEMKIVADQMGIDIYEVINAAATKPFGFTPYYPGPGLGGHCIPIDPFYLTWKAREFGLHTKFIELSGEINTSMPNWVFNKIVDALNKFNKSVSGSKILIVGIAYKKNVGDTRESPAIAIMEILRKKNAELAYVDPYVKDFPQMREHQFDLKSIELTDDNLQMFDCVVITTDHSNIDYDLIQRKAKLIIDTRRVYTKKHENVVIA